MMKKLKSVSLLLLRFCVLVYGNLRDENKIRDLIYKSLESVDNVCVRRSNYTHAVGCKFEFFLRNNENETLRVLIDQFF